MVLPLLFKFLRIPMTFFPDLLSKFPVGSSARMKEGSFTSERQIAVQAQGEWPCARRQAVARCDLFQLLFCLQRGRDECVDPVRSDGGDVSFELTIQVKANRVIAAHSANKELKDDFWAYTHTDENSNRVGEFAQRVPAGKADYAWAKETAGRLSPA